jgi:hypothetical protein
VLLLPVKAKPMSKASFEEFSAAMRLCEFRVYIAKRANYVHFTTKKREAGAWLKARGIASDYGVELSLTFPKRQPKRNDYGIAVSKDAFDHVPSQMKPAKLTKAAERLKRREEMFNPVGVT